MSHEHPPLDFKLYGLKHSWAGSRWLEFVEGQAGEPVWAVWLGHGGPDPAGPWCLVATLPADRHAAAMAIDGKHTAREVAFTAALCLANLTNPGGSLNEQDYGRYLRNIVPFVSKQADVWNSWPTVSWTVDSRSVQARTWRWAGAWAGFTTSLADVALVVVAHHLEPASLALEQADPRRYGFDARESIQYPGTLLSTRSAAGAVSPGSGGWRLHHDQARLLTT